MNTIVVSIEGVLRKVTDGTRINEGCELLNELADRYTRVFLTSGSCVEAEDWLDGQGIGYDLVLGTREDRVEHLRTIRYGYGYPVSLVVEPDPDLAIDIMAEGYTVLLFMHPAYAKPEWRPDHKDAVMSWDELKTLRRKDIDRRMTDVRVTGEKL